MSRLQSRGLSPLLVIALPVLLLGCVIPDPSVVDTVHVADTIVRTDTVHASDTSRDSELPVVSAVLGQPISEEELAYLRGRRLLIPVPGVHHSELPNTFDESRSQGARRHDAIDLAAPRGTVVLSVDAGRIARIDTSDRGGLSLYAADPSGRFVYYYAHLDRYRAGLRNGMAVARGDTLGFVGTTGNAPPDSPHLHFAISRLDNPRRWWDGTPIDPRPLLTETR